MRPLLKRILLAATALWLAPAQAHDGPHAEGEEHATIAAAVTGGVQRLPDGSLSVPKSLQRLLGLRTVVLDGSAATRTLIAEVQPQPDAPVLVIASEAGTLEAPAEGWLLPGTRVENGRVLAWLRPAVPLKDRARRNAQRAEIEQRLAIATLNAERLRMQSAVTPEGGVAPGNVYFEQTLAEEAGYKAQLAELSAGLKARAPVVARGAGILQDSPVRAGSVVAAGMPLFRLHVPNRLRLVAQRFEPLSPGSTPTATLRGQKLSFKGQQPLDGAAGWNLFFDLEGPADLQAGQLVEIGIVSDTATALPVGACQRSADGSGVVWLHSAAEQFAAVRILDCNKPVEIAGLEQHRVVTAGASLISRYDKALSP